jgi:hypothetical protein
MRRIYKIVLIFQHLRRHEGDRDSWGELTGSSSINPFIRVLGLSEYLRQLAGTQEVFEHYGHSG